MWKSNKAVLGKDICVYMFLIQGYKFDVLLIR